jgi:hypothetical protein
MATFQVPRNLHLRDLLAELHEGGPFEINGNQPFEAVRCSKCGQPIALNDPVCEDRYCDQVSVGYDERGCDQFLPGMIHVTVWHFTCEPEDQSPDPAVLLHMAQRIADPQVSPLVKIPALAEALMALDTRIEPCPACGAKLYWSAPAPPAPIRVWCDKCGYEVRSDARP